MAIQFIRQNILQPQESASLPVAYIDGFYYDFATMGMGICIMAIADCSVDVQFIGQAGTSEQITFELDKGSVIWGAFKCITVSSASLVNVGLPETFEMTV